jgi:hypothetical protein
VARTLPVGQGIKFDLIIKGNRLNGQAEGGGEVHLIKEGAKWINILIRRATVGLHGTFFTIMIRRMCDLSARRWFSVATLFGTTVLCLCVPAAPQVRKTQTPKPDSFLVGRRTFFDSGPPFEFYEILSVRSTSGGALVERIQVTPPGDVCTQPANVRVATNLIGESVADLLGSTNPCSIPEKELRRELKRCKKCLVFSGADVVMQVQCGGQSRRVRMDILDRDMFDPHPVTPEHTSWTLTLLGRLDRTLGATIMDRPTFNLAEPRSQPPTEPQFAALLGDLEKGKLDALFDRGSHAPSELFRQARNPPPGPSVELANSSPFRPTVYELPKYPPLARIAHISGQVTFKLSVKSDGHSSAPSSLVGNPILQNIVAANVRDWTFPTEAAGQDMQVAIEFKMNCPSVQR